MEVVVMPPPVMVVVLLHSYRDVPQGEPQSEPRKQHAPRVESFGSTMQLFHTVS
jgi:hypothetical protein